MELETSNAACCFGTAGGDLEEREVDTPSVTNFCSVAKQIMHGERGRGKGPHMCSEECAPGRADGVACQEGT